MASTRSIRARDRTGRRRRRRRRVLAGCTRVQYDRGARARPRIKRAAGQPHAFSQHRNELAALRDTPVTAEHTRARTAHTT